MTDLLAAVRILMAIALYLIAGLLGMIAWHLCHLRQAFKTEYRRDLLYQHVPPGR